jgi:mannose-6-phosphate isomerase-like protein (cupin superfamily)
MIISNKDDSYNTGDLELLKSYMLIGSRNVKDTGISLQISFIPVNSEQPVHNHEPEQVYYIIRGTGLMIIEDERKPVHAGDAIYIPGNKKHGIKNTGNEKLEYLTANAPAFAEEYENRLWPAK